MTHRLVTERLLLEHPTLDVSDSVLEYRELNRDHFRVWEPQRSDSFYTISEVELQIHNMMEQIAGEVAAHWLMTRQGSSEVIGQCSITNIVRGPFQACHLGFSLGHQYQRKGLMFEALSVVIPHVFQVHGLHRIMANYQPDNRGSERLLGRLGFTREGFAKSYLKIDGRWTDHVLTSLINPLSAEG